MVSLLATLLRGTSKTGITLTTNDHLDDLVEDLRTVLNFDHENKQAVADAIYEVLRELWTTSWDPATGRHISDPTIQWIVFHQIREGGGFETPSNLTGIFAKLTYIIRLVHARRLLERTRDASGIRIGDEDAAWKESERYVTVGHESTFNTIRTYQHLASALAFLTMGLSSIWWTDEKGHTAMLYRGQRIDLSHLRDIVGILEKNLVEVWEKEVLMGLKIHVNWRGAVDDLTNHEVGHSCFTNASNSKIFQQRNLLARHILNDPVLRGRFCTGVSKDTGEWMWNVAALDVFLDGPYRKLNHLIATIIDVASGSPIRITELGALNYRNTEDRSTRSFVILHEFISIMLHYGKASSQRGYDRTIPHALPAVAGDILLQNLYIARDFATFAAIQKWGPKSFQHRLYHDRLLVDYDSSMTSTAVTATLRKVAFPILRWKPGVQDVRHILLAFARHHCRATDVLMEPDEAEHIRGYQAGHTVGMERGHYGISNELWNRLIAEEIIPKYLQYSADMQRVLHIVPGRPSPVFV